MSLHRTSSALPKHRSVVVVAVVVVAVVVVAVDDGVEEVVDVEVAVDTDVLVLVGDVVLVDELVDDVVVVVRHSSSFLYKSHPDFSVDADATRQYSLQCCFCARKENAAHCGFALHFDAQWAAMDTVFLL